MLPGRAGPGQVFPPTERAVAWSYAPSDRGASALSPQRPARERRGAACPLRSPPSPRTRLGTPRTPLTPVPLHRPLLRDCRVRGRTGGGNTAEINSASADAASRGYCSRNGAVRGARWLPGRGGGSASAPGRAPARGGRTRPCALTSRAARSARAPRAELFLSYVCERRGRSPWGFTLPPRPPALSPDARPRAP